MTLTIKDDVNYANSTGNEDGDTVPLYSNSLSSLESDASSLGSLPATSEDNENKIILKLSSPSEGNFSVRISLSKTVQALISGASQHYKVSEDKIELQFDGEKMNPATVLSDFGLEDEDQIDVVFHK